MAAKNVRFRGHGGCPDVIGRGSYRPSSDIGCEISWQRSEFRARRFPSINDSITSSAVENRVGGREAPLCSPRR